MTGTADALAPTAVTGARGRLGRAVMSRLASMGRPAVPWGRPEYELDVPNAAEPLLTRDHPGLVIHCAAWTDVDGCARDPQMAMRRNAWAVRELAEATAAAGARLLVVSTNEVFDGRRTDGRGYREDDPVEPPNAYGASKLAGERAAAVAFGRVGRPADLWVARTAWLFGAGAPDFPAKILAAADQLPPGEALAVVGDEIGSPTYAPDLAVALLELTDRAPGGLYHLVNAGQASRAEWAAAVLRLAGRSTPVESIPQAAYPRPSTPPQWGVLDGTRAAARGVVLRHWPDALVERMTPVGSRV